MIYAVIGGVIGFILGALIIFLWMRAGSRTDAARIAELESRTASFEQAIADRVRAESALDQLRQSSKRELEFTARAAEEKANVAAAAHEAELTAVRKQAAAELDAEKRRASSELEVEKQKSAALLDAEKRRAATELDAEKSKAKTELDALREAHAQLEKVTKERTDHLRQEFKVLSETILKERTENLQTANKEQIGRASCRERV